MSESTTKVGVWVTLPLKPGHRDEAVELVQEALEAVKSEDGTLVYVLNADGKDENILYIYEVYSSQDAFTAHMGADWFKPFSDRLVNHLGGKPSFQLLTPLGGKPI
jgi:quinol monooxygenase YgiN